MSNIHLKTILQFPVKSCAPMDLSRAWVDEKGLDSDRRYLIVDENGLFITARKFPQLTQLLATPVNGGLILAADGHATLALVESDYPDEYQEVTVWKQEIQAQRCGELADQWISKLLDKPCRLVFFGANSRRPIKKFDTQEVSFADGYPLLLTSTASLDWVQERCPEPVDMVQFRPNLILSNSEAFEEDTWQEIMIGDVRFMVHSPCERCKLITLPPGQTEFSKQQEPLRTLLKYRRAHEGGALFGQNLIPLNTGIVAQGMEVKVLKSAPVDIVRPVTD